MQAFDLAERLQTPVIVLTDLDIGMNDWMCRDLKWDDAYQPDRGKVLSAEQIEEMAKFHRYLDVDGDGIPGPHAAGRAPKGAYFTRGSGHNMYGAYTEDAEEYQAVVDRLRRKWEHGEEAGAAAGRRSHGHQRIGLIADRQLRRRRARGAGPPGRGAASPINYLRVKAFPFGKDVQDFLDATTASTSWSRTATRSCAVLLMLETRRATPTSCIVVLHYDGLPDHGRRSVIVDGSQPGSWRATGAWRVIELHHDIAAKPHNVAHHQTESSPPGPAATSSG